MDTLPAFYEPIDGMNIAAWQESPEGIEVIAFSLRKSAVCPHCHGMSHKKTQSLCAYVMRPASL